MQLEDLVRECEPCVSPYSECQALTGLGEQHSWGWDRLDGRGGIGGSRGPAAAPCTAPGSQWELEASPAFRF